MNPPEELDTLSYKYSARTHKSGGIVTRKPPAGLNQFVTDAYALEGKENIIAFYRKWARDYDAQMADQGYRSPERIAGMLRAHLPVAAKQETEAVVLDAGCGTGLTGFFAVEHGLSILDGIDISGEMIAVARSRNIYRKLIVGDLNQPLPCADSTYDAVISSGTFTHGHVGSEPIYELVRVLKSGGLLACTIHFDLWHSRGFDRVLANLIGNGDLRCLALEEGPYFDDRENEGWFCVYQKS